MTHLTDEVQYAPSSRPHRGGAPAASVPGSYSFTGHKGGQIWPSLAHDRLGQRVLVVWADQRGVDSDISGTNVTLAGQVPGQDGCLISGVTGSQDMTEAACGGGTAMVTWEDRGAPTRTSTPPGSSGRGRTRRFR